MAIRRCTCKHAYQDARYGKGKRVMNKINKDKVVQRYRCTVCLKER